MGFGAVCRFLPCMGRMLGAGRCDMLEALEGAFDIARHGDFAGAQLIVPVESKAAVAGCIPVGGADIHFFKGGE